MDLPQQSEDQTAVKTVRFSVQIGAKGGFVRK